MDYTICPGGLLIHIRKDWPCANCRPGSIFESKGLCLCTLCARRILCASGAGQDGTQELLGDMTEALVLLEGQVLERSQAAN